MSSCTSSLTRCAFDQPLPMEFVFKPKHCPFEYVHTPEGGWQTRDATATSVGTRWQMDLGREVDLGLAPPEWSTTSQMNDPRPLGKSLFDSRFMNSPMGRGKHIVESPRAWLSSARKKRFCPCAVLPRSPPARHPSLTLVARSHASCLPFTAHPPASLLRSLLRSLRSSRRVQHAHRRSRHRADQGRDQEGGEHGQQLVRGGHGGRDRDGRTVRDGQPVRLAAIQPHLRSPSLAPCL